MIGMEHPLKHISRPQGKIFSLHENYFGNIKTPEKYKRREKEYTGKLLF